MVEIWSPVSSRQLASLASSQVEIRSFSFTSNALGIAACTYDPASNTGLLFTRRNKTESSFTIEFWRTGLRF